MSTEKAPRVTPISPPYEPDLEAELNKWMPPGAPLEPLMLFRTLFRNRDLANAMLPLGSLLLSKRAGITIREREVVIDRVAARCGCEYEWGVHAVAFGERAGLTTQQISATVVGDADAVWTVKDALLIRMVDELHDGSAISDDLWGLLAAEWSASQQLVLMALAGWYHLIAYIANGARVPLESWAQRFPAGE
jgi:4-carboxymuconolactone decarboxylase